MASDPDEVMTIEELAEFLKISKSSLYGLAREGVLPGTKVGKHWRFHKKTIIEWMKSHPEHSRKKAAGNE